MGTLAVANSPTQGAPSALPSRGATAWKHTVTPARRVYGACEVAHTHVRARTRCCCCCCCWQMVKVKGYELREKSKSDLLKQLEELKLEVPPVARCCPPPAQAAVATLARGRSGVISWWKLARQPSPGPPLRRAAGCTGLPWLAGWLRARCGTLVCAVLHNGAAPRAGC